MTNEKAIELLNRISDSQFDGPHGDERREALEMAVRALFSQQTVNDSQGLVNDCISRKAVMKEFADFVRESNNSDFAPTPTWNDAVSLVGSIPSVQPQACDDAISRDDAIMAVKTGALSAATIFGRTDEGATAYYETVKAIKALPSAQLDPQEIGYWECSNALLKMWIDNVLTDGEYYRIADKLNTYWKEKIKGKNNE